MKPDFTVAEVANPTNYTHLLSAKETTHEKFSTACTINWYIATRFKYKFAINQPVKISMMTSKWRESLGLSTFP